MTRPILALDADGVLVDLHIGYARAWQQAFGVALAERDPQAYWPSDRWAVEPIDAEQRLLLRAQFERPEMWESLPAIAGAVEACHRLHNAGYELVCVTALEARFQPARLRNLKSLGFPIRKVVATGHMEGQRSPKADAIQALRPVAFVDDYIAYMRGVPTEVHTALVLRAPNGSPNVGDELKLARSVHQDLADFADHWLGPTPAA
jgi:phosphoglycolate phosphatase-like HAD superfamily hydrolase